MVSIFLFSPLPGEDFQFDEHIFHMDWFNHHLEIHRLIHGGFSSNRHVSELREVSLDPEAFRYKTADGLTYTGTFVRNSGCLERRNG